MARQNIDDAASRDPMASAARRGLAREPGLLAPGRIRHRLARPVTLIGRLVLVALVASAAARAQAETPRSDSPPGVATAPVEPTPGAPAATVDPAGTLTLLRPANAGLALGGPGDGSLAERFLKRRSTHPNDGLWLRLVRGLFWCVLALLAIYTARHWLFTVNRLFRPTRAPYIDIDNADWPLVTVFVAAHDEEAVVAHCIEALLDVSYPPDRLRIVPVNDRSQDRTAEIIEDFRTRHPTRISPFHRVDGKPGKAAALKDAMAYAEGEIVIIFDADYIPGRGLIKQLVAPFFDPEIGAVMGRVIPLNADSNLLTRLLELERSGGYQVDQQARMNLSLVPQFGGTVGGIRRCAMDAAGGWHDDILAEDTDITYRLLLRGWKTVYQNRSECYEEVPEAWLTRIRQIKRWSKGHNQTLARRLRELLVAPLPWRTKFDGLLLLGVFVMPSVLVFGSFLALILYFTNSTLLANGAVALFAAAACGSVGNLAAFFEIVAAVKLDGNNRRLRLIPFNLLGFIVSCLSISRATWDLVINDWLFRKELKWDKTTRFRRGDQAATAVAGAAVGAGPRDVRER